MAAPPTELQRVPCSSGSASSGDRAPQMNRNSVLARLLPQPLSFAHRIGNCGGGGELLQLVFNRPASVRVKSTTPLESTAPSPLSWPAVVHASRNAGPEFETTVTYSRVGVGA